MTARLCNVKHDQALHSLLDGLDQVVVAAGGVRGKLVLRSSCARPALVLRSPDIAIEVLRAAGALRVRRLRER